MIISLAATLLAIGQIPPADPHPEYDVVYVQNFDPREAGLIAKQVNNMGTIVGVNSGYTLGGIWQRGRTQYDPGIINGTTKASHGSSTGIGFTTYAGVSNNGIVTGLRSGFDYKTYEAMFGASYPNEDAPRNFAFRITIGGTAYMKPVPPMNPTVVRPDTIPDYVSDVNNAGHFMFVGASRLRNIGRDAVLYAIFYGDKEPVILPHAYRQVLRTIPVDINENSDLLTVEEASYRRFAVVREREGDTHELKPIEEGMASVDGYKNLILLPESIFEFVSSGTLVSAPEINIGKYVVSAMRNNRSVVGGAFDKNGTVKGVVWDANYEPKLLPKVDGFDSSHGCRVTDDGTVIGVVWNRHIRKVAQAPWVVWVGGQSPVFLKDCVDKRYKLNFNLLSIMDVSDNGIILALLNGNLKQGEYALLVPKGMRLQ